MQEGGRLSPAAEAGAAVGRRRTRSVPEHGEGPAGRRAVGDHSCGAIPPLDAGVGPGRQKMASSLRENSPLKPTNGALRPGTQTGGRRGRSALGAAVVWWPGRTVIWGGTLKGQTTYTNVAFTGLSRIQKEAWTFWKTKCGIYLQHDFCEWQNFAQLYLHIQARIQDFCQGRAPRE